MTAFICKHCGKGCRHVPGGLLYGCEHNVQQCFCHGEPPMCSLCEGRRRMEHGQSISSVLVNMGWCPDGDELEYDDITTDPRLLHLGLKMKHVDYSWRAYTDRSVDDRASYDSLKESMIRAGTLTNPLIVFRSNVLIGMRRCEIAVELKWKVVTCWLITTDINGDCQPDRVYALKGLYCEVKE